MRILVISLSLALAVPAWTQGVSQAGTTPAQAAQPQQQAPLEKLKPATLSGQVLSLAGGPLKKADVTLRRTDGPAGMAGAQRTATDAGGNFTFSELEPGKYMLSAEKTGFVRQAYGAARPGRMSGSMITLSPGQALTGAVLKLTPHGVITGKVVDEDGEAVGNVTVQAMQQRYFRNRRQWMPVDSEDVNDLGEYRISGLAPGQYVLAVAPQRFGARAAVPSNPDKPDEGYVMTYYPGATAIEQAAPVQVTSGGEQRNIDFRLTKTHTYRIKGKVVDGTTGKPVRNVMVSALSADGPAFGFMNRNMAPVRNAEGTFEITGVVPGSYTLVLARMGNESGSARQDVTVSDGNVSNVILTVQPGFSVGGSIKVEGLTTFATDGLRVALQPQSGMGFGGPGRGGAGQVKDDGTFKLDATTHGKYTVSVFPLTDAYIKSVRVANQTMPDLNVDLTAGPAPIEVVLSTTGATVQGVVQDSKKRPTQGVTVALVPDTALRGRTELYKNATTDANGSFSFTAIPPGEYKVFAWEDIEDYGWTDPALISRYENQGKAVSLKESGSENLTIGFIAPEGGSQLEREADAREQSNNK